MKACSPSEAVQRDERCLRRACRCWTFESALNIVYATAAGLKIYVVGREHLGVPLARQAEASLAEAIVRTIERSRSAEQAQ